MRNQIVGAWYYEATGAAFPAHMIVFHHDGTLVSSNPDRGEVTNSASSGMGAWGQDLHNGAIVGRFVEVNADLTTHEHTSNLIVDFSITLDADSFHGRAEAILYRPDGTLLEGPFPATLRGQRITLKSKPPVAVTP
jgi:hypothetical protein